MIRLVCLLVCCTGIFAAPQPETPSPAAAQEKAASTTLLASQDGSQLAWGAYLAANYEQKELIPSILPLLKSGNHLVRLAALDALIRLKAEVPEDDLVPIVKEWPDPVLILFSRDVKMHAAFLMRLLDDSPSDLIWIALNSLLSTQPPEGYAGKLLREWRIETKITVLDSGGIGSNSGGGRCGDGPGLTTPGFPPVVAYHLYEDPQPGDTLIVGGIHPISYRKQYAFYGCSALISRDKYRLDYLESLARIHPGASDLQKNWGAHSFNVNSYANDAEALLTKMRESINDLKDKLISLKLLTREEAAAGPTLYLEVIDARTDRSTPLPKIDWHL